MRHSTPFEPSPGVWVIIGAIVILNVWYDYHHPLGIVFDAIILTILFVAWLKS